MTAETLSKQLKGKNPPRVIDVRTGIEFRSGHIPGALHLPTLKLIFSRRQLPRDKSSLLVITCEHGPRAALAKGLLGLFGYRNCELLAGHMYAYRKKNYRSKNNRVVAWENAFMLGCVVCKLTLHRRKTHEDRLVSGPHEEGARADPRSGQEHRPDR